MAQVKTVRLCKEQQQPILCTGRESKDLGCGCWSGVFGHGHPRTFSVIVSALLGQNEVRLAAEADVVCGEFEQGCNSAH